MRMGHQIHMDWTVSVKKLHISNSMDHSNRWTERFWTNSYEMLKITIQSLIMLEIDFPEEGFNFQIK